MTYQIAESRLPSASRPLAKADSLEAAEAWVRDYASRLRDDPEVFFDLDEDGHDAADACIMGTTTCLVLTIERIA